MQGTIQSNPYARLGIAVILCFASAYFSEITIGALATIPFILLLSAFAYLIYKRVFRLAALSALSAFIVKCVFSDDTKTVILFTLFCTLLTVISALAAKYVYENSVKRTAKKTRAVIFTLLYALSFVVYIYFYGTITGNLESKSLNEAYIENTYPEEQLLVGNTYYSFRDKRYVTEFSFTSKERYSALVSADSESEAVIDGCRDLRTSELMNGVLADIRTALSTFAYEGEDFVIRNGSLDCDITSITGSDKDSYSDKMTFEIALYYQFRDEAGFKNMCQSYIEHLKGFEGIRYKEIIFYAFDTSKSDNFAYTLTYTYDTDAYNVSEFDKNSFNGYFTEKDTHKYWELLG